MNDKEIKHHLSDAGKYFADAAKAWPKYKDAAWRTMSAGLSRIDIVYDYVERPMGGEENEC